MDARFSRSSIPRRKDPHEWNTWDNYRTIHDVRLEDHPFVDWSKEQALGFDEEDEETIVLRGSLFCLNDVVVRVRKFLETQHTPKGLLRVKGFSYRYVAWVEGRHPILRYHNTHQGDDLFHHRVFNWRTGEQVLYETLHRFQFPTLSEVLDEVEAAYLAYA